MIFFVFIYLFIFRSRKNEFYLFLCSVKEWSSWDENNFLLSHPHPKEVMKRTSCCRTVTVVRKWHLTKKPSKLGTQGHQGKGHARQKFVHLLRNNWRKWSPPILQRIGRGWQLNRDFQAVLEGNNQGHGRECAEICSLYSLPRTLLNAAAPASSDSSLCKIAQTKGSHSGVGGGL